MATFLDFLDDRDELPSLGLELLIEARSNPQVADHVRTAMDAHQLSVAKVIERYFAVMGGTPPLPPDQLAPALAYITVGFALARKAGSWTGAGSTPFIKAVLGLPTESERPEADPHA
jgi:hypothetical protein